MRQIEGIYYLKEGESGLHSFDEGEYSCVGISMDPEKDKLMLEKEKERKEELQKVIENLDTTLGALAQVNATKDQEEKLDKFIKAIKH